MASWLVHSTTDRVVLAHYKRNKTLFKKFPSLLILWPALHLWYFKSESKSFHFKVFSIGFVLYFKEEPILGYCVDSGFREDVFEFFFQASTVIVDARDNGTKEHASVGTLFSGIKNKVIILSIEIKKRQKFSYIYTGLFLTENSPTKPPSVILLCSHTLGLCLSDLLRRDHLQEVFQLTVNISSLSTDYY